MRMRRSKVLESPLGGGCGLVRELGLLGKLESGTGVGVRAWAQGLRRKGEVLKYRSAVSVGPFVFDEAAGVLTYAEAMALMDGGDFDARVVTWVDFFHLPFTPLIFGLRWVW